MGKIWELDYYSKPILDENKKKIWEVLICDSPQNVVEEPESIFRYAKFCSNQQVNSVWLRTALSEAIAQSGQPPQKIRFFRVQMNNMITKACEDLGIPAYPSRRTFNLNRWLKERMEEVYPHYPGFVPVGPNPSVLIESQPPQPLPDALIGQQWAFVTLEASAFAEMPEWDISFKEAFPLQARGVTPDSRIPGLIIFSPRAMPLAAWISGLELACLKFDSVTPARLLLETGVSDRWILANIKDAATIAEAKGFEEAKQKAQNVHFLAVQSDRQAESFAGFWLLQDDIA
ncbi:Tab2/Atab2 family RNA-binding protein [Argonema antarcticum]|uniref:Tab2/Atab2 family RNA-binding protein n=1 Tax=Argonema antarcticum TaxID=2942763 RepID=UPI002013ABCD|nr:Tab2/Atab2 family RNA-binding protein [Argonema antarcticum]MCL1471241.1 Tab2/Atab2 family RNA-binding protein [Argonema antarcticum A004/B2]